MTAVRIDIPPNQHPQVRAAAALTDQTIAEFCAQAAVEVAKRTINRLPDVYQPVRTRPAIRPTITPQS